MVGSCQPDAQVCPRCPTIWHKSYLCHGWEDLLPPPPFNFSTIFNFSISFFTCVSLHVVSPILKTSPLPRSQRSCQAHQTFSYGYPCLFLLCSLSYLSCSLRCSHSPFSPEQNPRLCIGSALIQLSFHSGWFSRSVKLSLLSGYLAPPLPS